MKNSQFASLPPLLYHLFAITLIFLVLAFVRYPVLINSDYNFTADEGLMANSLLTLLDGGPIRFYTDNLRTEGLLTFTLMSVPFTWLLGTTTLAFQLPGTLYYSAYLWTTYLVAKSLIPRSAPIVLPLIFFASPAVMSLSTHNYVHILSAALGNLMFLLFIRAKSSAENNGRTIFLICLTMGLAIYAFTYSLLYIATVVILFALTHPQWDSFRKKISFQTLSTYFSHRKSKLEIFTGFLDLTILIFSIAIIFSYIFGGFGLKIGGVTFLQINNLHKPVLQLLGVLLIRFLIYRNDLKQLLHRAKSFSLKAIHPETKNLIFSGGAGFLIGFSPRLASILVGETVRGGQGFHVDFLPTKLLEHTWGVMTLHGPNLFGFLKPIQNFISGPIEFQQVITITLLGLLLTFLALATFSILSNNLASIKNILQLAHMKFHPLHIILLAPALVCAANIVVENGSETRWLFPLFGVMVLWLAIYVDKVREKLKWFPALVLMVWGSFYSIVNYNSYQEQHVMQGVTPVKFPKHPLHDLISFLESKDISLAYSGYHTSSVGTFLSQRKINISEYSDTSMEKTRKEMTLDRSDFAVVSKDNKVTIIYSNFLKEKNIKFMRSKVHQYEVFWGFEGVGAEINKLRSLIPG